MEVIFWYALFATTTSFAALYELFIPALKELEKQNPENNVVTYKWIAYFIFFCFTLVLAPLMLPACLIPSAGTKFKNVLVKELL